MVDMNMQENTDPWLHRFIEAQHPIYEQVLPEAAIAQDMRTLEILGQL